MPLLKKRTYATALAAAAVDSVIVDDDTLPAMPSPPAPPQVSSFVSNDSEDDDDAVEESDETEEEDEAEESDEDEEEESEEEPSPPPKKRARGGGVSNDPLAKIAAIAKTLNKKKKELHKRTMTQAIEIISTLLDKHATEIAEKIEIGDFVADSDGMHIDVCVLPADLHKIVSGSKNSGDWVDTLSNRIYESCAMEISFGGDNEDVLVVTLDLDDE